MNTSMGVKAAMKDNIFLDTAFAIALSIETDTFHNKAMNLSRQIEAGEVRLVTTRAILLEIGNALAKHNVSVNSMPATVYSGQWRFGPLNELFFGFEFFLFRR